jgi:hypothetical protein
MSGLEPFDSPLDKELAGQYRRLVDQNRAGPALPVLTGGAPSQGGIKLTVYRPQHIDKAHYLTDCDSVLLPPGPVVIRIIAAYIQSYIHKPHFTSPRYPTF